MTEAQAPDRRHRPDRRLDEAYREAARVRDRKRYLRLKGSEELRQKNRLQAKKMREKHPEKVAARLMVRRAIERGDLAPQPCRVCGERKAHAHHEDYSQPLDVWWLCVKHHHERHHELRAHAEQKEG